MVSRKCLFQKGDEWIDAMCETRSKCEGQDVNGESEYSVRKDQTLASYLSDGDFCFEILSIHLNNLVRKLPAKDF